MKSEILTKILNRKYLWQTKNGELELKDKNYSIIIKLKEKRNIIKLNLEAKEQYSEFLNSKTKDINKKVDETIFITNQNHFKVLFFELKSTKPEFGKILELEHQKLFINGEISKQFLASTAFLIYVNTLLKMFYNLQIDEVAYVVFSFKSKSKLLSKTKPGKKDKLTIENIAILVEELNLKIPILNIQFSGRPSRRILDFYTIEKRSRFSLLDKFCLVNDEKKV